MPIEVHEHSKTFLTGEEIAQFRKIHELEIEEVSRWLGLDVRDYIKLERGEGYTKVIGLALAALDYGLEPWKPRGPSRR